MVLEGYVPLLPVMKTFFLFFFTQAASYSVLTLNFRAIAVGHLGLAIFTDATNATLGYVVIRKIAKSEDTLIGWLGYVLGSMVGTVIGMKLI